MTISVVQSVAINNGYSGDFGAAVTAGNSIVMAVTGHNGTASDISTSDPQYDGGSVTGASKLVEQNSPSEAGAAYSSIWLLPDVAGGGTSLSVTITNSPAASYVGIIAYEVTGLGSSPTADKSNSNTGSGTSDQNSGASGNITQGPEFVLGTVTQDGTIGSSYPPSGWTSMNVGTDNSVAGYQIPADSGGSYTYDLGAGSAHWAGAIATIYAGSSGVTATGAVAMAGMAVSGSGHETITATGTVAMAGMAVSGSGVTGGNVSASGGVTMAAMRVQGGVPAAAASSIVPAFLMGMC